MVLVVGISGSQEGEGHDRSAIELPAAQEGLVRAVTQAAGNKPVVVVCCSGSPIALNWANDNVPAMKELVHKLLLMRVRPYYLYQCDPISGSAHFRTSVQKGLEIIQGMRGFTTGYAVPSYVIDAPGGGGKIPLQPNYVAGRDGDFLLLRNYEGEIFRYPDPLD